VPKGRARQGRPLIPGMDGAREVPAHCAGKKSSGAALCGALLQQRAGHHFHGLAAPDQLRICVS